MADPPHVLNVTEASTVLRCATTDPDMLALLPIVDAYLYRATGRKWELETTIPFEAKAAARILITQWHENPGMIGNDSESLNLGFKACLSHLSLLALYTQEFNGRHGSGYCHLMSAIKGETIESLVGLIGCSGDQTSLFESVISEDGHIKQLSSTDLSEMLFRVKLKPPAELTGEP